MTLSELEACLKQARDEGATDESPVIVEGHDDEDNLIQAGIDTVTTEHRCEDGAQGLYLNITGVTFG